MRAWFNSNNFFYRSKTINYDSFIKFVEDLASQKKLDPKDLKDKLTNCGLPGTANTTVSGDNALIFFIKHK